MYHRSVDPKCDCTAQDAVNTTKHISIYIYDPGNPPPLVMVPPPPPPLRKVGLGCPQKKRKSNEI